MRKTIAVLAGLAVLTVANYSIHSRELLLTEGRTVLLQLAPVDPRSLMQGDYMALRFQVAVDAFGRQADAGIPPDGRIVIGLDERNVGRYRRLDNGSPLAADEIRMRYRLRNDRPKFATNAWFFQEGDAGLYARARYGEFRVDDRGDAILVAMRGEDGGRLGIGLDDARDLGAAP